MFFFNIFLCRPALGLVLALGLTLRPIETIPPGTTRTTEVGSEATTGATGGPTTTAEETEAITSAAITRTGGEAATATSPIGRVVAVEEEGGEEEEVEEEAGMIAIRTITHTAPGEGARAHQRSAQAPEAALATRTAHLLWNPDVPGAPATPHAPGPPHRATVVASPSVAPPRMLS